MNNSVLKPWPQVPACYGWLALDRRGQWRLQDELVTHPGLIAFLNANYRADDEGCWLVQNGPQRVFVALQAAPWIARLHPDRQWHAQDGRLLELRGDFFIDADSRVFVDSAAGAILLDDRDLADFVAGLCDNDGKPASDEALLALLADDEVPQGPSSPALFWQGRPLQRLRGSAATHFGFVSEPTDQTGQH